MSDLTEHIPQALKEAVLSEFVGKQGEKLTHGEVTICARKWGLSNQCVRDLYIEGQVDFGRIRQATAIKATLIQHRVLDGLVDDVNDEETLRNIAPEKKATMAKQLGDLALNSLNGTSGTGGTTINIGELKAIIDQRRERPAYESVAEELRRLGRLQESVSQL